MNTYKPCTCGGTVFYRALQYSGVGQEYVDCNGKMTDDNEGMHDGIECKSAKTAYCADCHKRARAATKEKS